MIISTAVQIDMTHINTLPIAPSEPREVDPVFVTAMNYVHTGSDDAWSETQMAIQSFNSLASAQNIFSVLEIIYRRAQTAIPPTSETVLERHRAVLEAMQARASHLQARDQERQFLAQRERDIVAENAQDIEERDAQGAMLQTLRIGPQSDGTESALLAAADRYDLDRASAIIDAADNINALNRTFEASLIVLQTSGDAARQRSHALLQELLRARVRKLSAETEQQQQQQQDDDEQSVTRGQNQMEQQQQQQQQRVREVLQSKLDNALSRNQSVGASDSVSSSWSDSLSRLPCWVVFLAGVVVLAIFVAFVAFISGIVSRNRAMRKQKQLEQEQLNVFAYNLLQQQQQQ